MFFIGCRIFKNNLNYIFDSLLTINKLVLLLLMFLLLLLLLEYHLGLIRETIIIKK